MIQARLSLILRLAVTALLFKTIGHIEMDHCKNQTEQQQKRTKQNRMNLLYAGNKTKIINKKASEQKQLPRKKTSPFPRRAALG